METFKYNLDKSSKKFICPNCNKKSFVKYVDNETGNYLTDDLGRCDRESKCTYHKAPQKGKKCYLINFLSFKSISDKAYKATDQNGIINFIPKSQILEPIKNNCWITEWYLKSSNIQYLGNEYKYFNLENTNLINSVIAIIPVPDTPSFHNLELLEKLYCNNPIKDNFTTFLKTIFSTDEVFTAKQNYLITGTNYFWNNASVFWQIDHKDQIHGAKIMLYDSVTGKRIKKPYNHINWLHKAIKEPDFKLNQCLFGLHRINEDHQKTIAIVESEKTAIVMSILLPEFIWMATGSKQNLKLELLEPIKKRNIILYPDKGEFKDWKNKATGLNGLGFKIAVSELIEQTNFKNGFDLADYYFNL